MLGLLILSPFAFAAFLFWACCRVGDSASEQAADDAEFVRQALLRGVR